MFGIEQSALPTMIIMVIQCHLYTLQSLLYFLCNVSVSTSIKQPHLSRSFLQRYPHHSRSHTLQQRVPRLGKMYLQLYGDRIILQYLIIIHTTLSVINIPLIDDIVNKKLKKTPQNVVSFLKLKSENKQEGVLIVYIIGSEKSIEKF